MSFNLLALPISSHPSTARLQRRVCSPHTDLRLFYALIAREHSKQWCRRNANIHVHPESRLQKIRIGEGLTSNQCIRMYYISVMLEKYYLTWVFGLTTFNQTAKQNYSINLQQITKNLQELFTEKLTKISKYATLKKIQLHSDPFVVWWESVLRSLLLLDWLNIAFLMGD